MKTFSYFILTLALIGQINATDKVVTLLVTNPVYHKWEDGEVRFIQVPHVGWELNSFWRSEFYASKYMAGHSNIRQDINLISLYNITVEFSYKNEKEHLNIMTKQAVRPDGFKFSIKEVALLTAQSIRADFPNKEGSLIYLNGVPVNEP